VSEGAGEGVASRGPRAALLGLCLLSACSLCGCLPAPRLYSTWASLGDKPLPTAPVAFGAAPPPGAVPWAGTVSHHLLADREIDAWFGELARRRKVEVFYILSPSHWGLSMQAYSITDGSWRVPDRLVESDRGSARGLARRLGVSLEPEVFDPEHGVSTLVPYIARYFPGARIVAVAYRGEPPVSMPAAAALASALAPSFDAGGRRRNFLLVSADFSHHGDAAQTAAKDAVSAGFFAAPSRDSWILAGCDNRPGICVLARLLPPGSADAVLCRTNSFALSGQGGDDITSYFFSYFWSP
jgi:MEMO1 family protein